MGPPDRGPERERQASRGDKIQLAFVTLGLEQHGDRTSGKRFQSMRAIFPMYDTRFQFMALRDSGIASVSDLSGKRVGIGPAGGTAGTFVPEFFKSLKIDASLETGSWADLAVKVEQGALDALAVGAGVPFPSFAQLEAKTKVRYIPFSQSQIVALRLALPELGASLVAAGSYPSMVRHYQTVGLFNFAVADRKLPDDLIYAILEAVFVYHDEMMSAHPAAAETIPSNFTRNSFLPFHDGAAEWYNRKSSTGVVRGD
jgi:TRAP transporter TAXI family solute receptor